MDYKIFARENHNLTTLNSTEIIDPIAGLKEFLIGESANGFKEDLRHLLLAVFEKHGWRQYGAPLNLYLKARRVAKLMDFVWLIVTCEVGTQNETISVDGYYLMEQYRERTFMKLFPKTPPKGKPGSIPASSLARAIFDRRFGLLLKDNIVENWLEVALANQPALRLDTEALKYYQLFADDVDHPDQLFEEQIELRYGDFYDVFCYIDELKFPKSVRRWFSLVSTTDHWKSHNDPGNVFFIREVIQQMIERAWLWSRVGFPEVGNRGIKKEYVKDLAALEIADPLGYIGYFFDRRRLHKWKQLLETWLRQSLSDKSQIDTEVTEKDCSDIIKLVQVLQLILHRA